MNKMKSIVMALVCVAAAGVFTLSLAEDGKNLSLAELKAFIDQSRELITQGTVEEITLEESVIKHMHIDEWETSAGSYMALCSPRLMRFRPAPGAHVKGLKSLADKSGKKSFELRTVSSLQVSDNPERTHIVNAHRQELNIMAYNSTDKMVYLLDLEPFNIRVKPRFLRRMKTTSENISRSLQSTRRM